MNNSSNTRFTSLCLKSVGVILIASSLLDYLTLALPFQLLDSQWQNNFTSQVVDRGIVPMVGMAFLLVAYWIDSNLGNTSKQSAFDIKLPAFVLSLLLGVMFLILVPLHINNLRLTTSNALIQIEQKTSEAETQISDQYEQLNDVLTKPERLQQLESRIKDLNSTIASGQFQGQQLNAEQLQHLSETKQQLQGLKELAKNPQALEKRLSELQTQLKEQKLARETKAKTEVVKQGLRTGISSLMLGIGYLLIGWTGLKSIEEIKTKPHQI